MGGKESKEEVIIAQAGNSGGQTNETNKFSAKTIVEIVFMILAVLIVLFYLYNKCKKHMTKKIQEQIRASQELV